MRRTLLQTASQASSFTTRPSTTSAITARIQSIQPQRISSLTQRISTPSCRRLYSTEQSQSSDKAEAQEAEPPAAEDPVKKELDAAKKEIVELKDKYLRSVADFRNLQVITDRKIKADKEFAISKFARDLLDSVDNLDRALGVVPESVVKAHEASEDGEGINKDLKNLYGGLKMTENVLMGTLKKHGLERFDPAEKGDKFDPNIHDAVFQAPQEGKENQTVFTTIQKGFSLNGRVIRAAKVGVVHNP